CRPSSCLQLPRRRAARFRSPCTPSWRSIQNVVQRACHVRSVRGITKNRPLITGSDGSLPPPGLGTDSGVEVEESRQVNGAHRLTFADRFDPGPRHTRVLGTRLAGETLRNTGVEQLETLSGEHFT